MAKSINMVILLGNLTRDPELRYTQNGTAVANCSMATNKSWRDNSGELQESVEFHNLVFWSNIAELVAEFCRKGSKVHVIGELQTRSWETEGGVKKYKTEVRVREVIFLDNKGDYNPAEPPSETEKSNLGDDFDKFMGEKEDDLEVDDQVSEIDDISDEIPF